MSATGHGRAEVLGRVAALSAIYLAFAMPIAMLGVAWPDIRDALGRDSGELGVLAGCYGVGRLSSAASSGVLLRRLSFGRAMLASAVAVAGATAWVATSPAWAFLVAAVGAVGVASGALESLGSRFIAVSASARTAGVLAGSYGVGATIGPALVALSGRWQVAYGVAAVVVLAAGAVFLSGSLRWPEQVEVGVHPGSTGSAASPRPGRAAVLVSLAMFAVFVGIEVTTGQWTATFLEQARGLDRRLAGIAVSGFWGGLTVGRMALGAVDVSRRTLVTLATLLVPLLLAVAVGPPRLAPVFLILIGLALAPMFPVLLAATADRVGADRAGQVSGWQLLAGNAGATVFPALVGLVVAMTGPGAPAAVLVLMAATGAALIVRAVVKAR
jgi:fucose permease